MAKLTSISSLIGVSGPLFHIEHFIRNTQTLTITYPNRKLNIENDTWNWDAVRIGCFFQGITDSSLYCSRLTIGKRKGNIHS